MEQRPASESRVADISNQRTSWSPHVRGAYRLVLSSQAVARLLAGKQDCCRGLGRASHWEARGGGVTAQRSCMLGAWALHWLINMEPKPSFEEARARGSFFGFQVSLQGTSSMSLPCGRTRSSAVRTSTSRGPSKGAKLGLGIYCRSYITSGRVIIVEMELYQACGVLNDFQGGATIWQC